MAYPLNESFETEPTSGSYSVSNGTVVGYNALDQCLDVSGGGDFGWVRFNQSGSSDVWFEADIVLVKDNTPDTRLLNYKYFGIQLSSSSSLTEGIRFGFYTNYLFLRYLNNGNSTVVEIQLGDVIYIGAVVGTRYTLGIKILENPNVVNARAVQVFLNGVLIYELYGAPNWVTPSRLWVPEVFRYNCDIKVYAIRGGLGSSITPWPASIECNAPSRNRPFRISQNNLIGFGDVAKYGSRFISLRPKRQSIYFHGKGSIIGTLKKAADPDSLPISRRLYLVEEDSYMIVGEVWSDQDGNYRFDLINENLHWTVLASDYEGNFRSVVANNLKAVRV